MPRDERCLKSHKLDSWVLFLALYRYTPSLHYVALRFCFGRSC